MDIWQHFSKRTLILIAILALVTAGLLYLAIRQDQPTPKVSMAPTPTVSPAHTTLSITPGNASTSARQTANIVIDSHSNKVSGIQLNLSYDPTVLANVTIQQGQYFTNPNVLLHNVDKQNGRITLVMAIQPTAQQASGSGTVATISYTFLPTTKESTTISFLPKTAVTQEGELSSVLATTTNLTIAIPTRAPQLETVPATSAAQ